MSRLTEFVVRVTTQGQQQLGRMSQAARRAIQTLSPLTRRALDIRLRTERAEAGLERLQERARGTGGALRNLLAGIGLAAAGGFIVRATGEFEDFRAVLRNTLQDVKLADGATYQLLGLAKKTPLEANEIFASYNKLLAQNVALTERQFVSLGDLASSQSKSIEQMVEAVLDAKTGEFERLKEFGIKASKAGDKVTFSFKGMSKTVAFTDKAIADYLISVGQMRSVAGSMEARSKTLNGQISNFKDALSQAAVEIGQKLKPALVWLLDTGGKLLNYIKENSRAFITAAGVMAGAAVAQWIYTASTVAATVGTSLLQMAVARLNKAMMKNPIMLIAFAAVAAGFAVYELYKKSEKFRYAIHAIAGGVVSFFEHLPILVSKMWERVKQFFVGLWTFIRNLPIIKFIVDMNIMIVQGLVGAVQWAWDIIAQAWDWVVGKVVKGWDWIVSAISTGWTWIKDKIKDTGALVSSIFSPIVNAISSAFKTAFDWIDKTYNKLKNSWLGKKIFGDPAEMKKGLQGMAGAATGAARAIGDHMGQVAKDAATAGGKGAAKKFGAKEDKRDYLSEVATKMGKGRKSAAGGSPAADKVAAGGSRPSTFIFNIGKFQDKTEIKVNSLSEGKEDIVRQLQEIFMRVMHGATQLAT